MQIPSYVLGLFKTVANLLAGPAICNHTLCGLRNFCHFPVGAVIRLAVLVFTWGVVWLAGQDALSGCLSAGLVQCPGSRIYISLLRHQF